MVRYQSIIGISQAPDSTVRSVGYVPKMKEAIHTIISGIFTRHWMPI